MMSFGGKDWKDLILFGRVISMGLMIGGYAFGGVVVARWMAKKEFLALAVAMTPPLAVVLGLWQGWLFLTQLMKNNKKKTDN